MFRLSHAGLTVSNFINNHRQAVVIAYLAVSAIAGVAVVLLIHRWNAGKFDKVRKD